MSRAAPRTILENARVFDGARILSGASVALEGGRIAAMGAGLAVRPGDLAVDLGGRLLAPGFVDVQVNGGGGVLFNSRPDVAGIRAIAAAHRRFGTTALLPTLISDAWPAMERAVAAVRAAIAEGVPGVRGIHVEGPYLNPDRRGVHPAGALRGPDAGALALLSGAGLGRVVVTVAPERVSADFIRALAGAGVRVCAGHTAADFETVAAALAAGISGFTHLFNAMPPIAGRAPGPVGAALLDEASWCGVIADGHHLHAACLRLAIRAKPPGKVMLVTDAMPTVGAGTRTFELMGETVRAEGGRLTTADGTLAGSDLDMAGAVRNAMRDGGVALEEALRMASLYPAAFLGLDDRIGRIAPGFDADLVLLDEALRATATWIGGVAEGL